jgi:hypothetical protein
MTERTFATRLRYWLPLIVIVVAASSAAAAILINRDSSRAPDLGPADRTPVASANLSFWENLRLEGAAYVYFYESFARMKRDADDVVVGTITAARLGRVRQSNDQIQLSPNAPVTRIATSDAFFTFKVDEVLVGQAPATGEVIVSRPLSEIDEPGARAAVAQVNRNLPSGRVLGFLKFSDPAPDGTPTYFFINDQAVLGSTPRSPTDQVLADEGPSKDLLLGVGQPGSLDALIEAVRRLP